MPIKESITGFMAKAGQTSAGRFMSAAASTARAHPRMVFAGLAAGAGVGVMREGQGPVESALVLGPAFAGAGIALSAGGWAGLKRTAGQVAETSRFWARAPGDWRGPGAGIFRDQFETAMANNPFMKHVSNVMPQTGRPEYLARAEFSHTGTLRKLARTLRQQHITTPYWMRAAAVASEQAMVAQPQTLAQLQKMGILESEMGQFARPSQILRRARGDEEFARQLAGRIGTFGEMGLEQLATPAATGAIPIQKAGYVTYTDRSKLVEAVRQIRPELAEELAGLPQDVRVTGVTLGGRGGALQALEYQLGTHRFVTPIVGPGGMVKAGINERNLYVARRQVYAGSLDSLINGSGAAAVFDLDVTIARYIKDYYALAAREGGARVGDLARFLGGMSNIPVEMGYMPGVQRVSQIGSALIWGRDFTRRPSRLGRPGRAEQRIRAMEAQFTAPGTEDLARLMGVGPHVETWAGTGRLGQRGILALAGQGFLAMGSESAARGGTFYNVADIGKLKIGAYSTPIDKSLAMIRDVTKGYWMAGGGGTQWRPFATAAYRNMMGSNVGLAMHYQGIFESEVDLLTRTLYAGRGLGPTTPQAVRDRIGTFFTDLGITDPSEQAKMRSALQRIAHMREGMFAAEIPRGATMVQEVEQVLYGMDESIRRYVGKTLPSNVAIGLDELNNPVYPSFSKRGGGSALLRSVKELEGGRYLVRWEEHVAAANAKFGSDVGKMFSVGLKEGEAGLVIKVINRLRRTPKFASRLYGNQAFVPLLSSVAERTVGAFTLAPTLAKLQNAPDVMLANLSAIYLPQMSALGQRRVLSHLARYGVTPAPGGGLEFAGRGMTEPRRRRTYQRLERGLRGIYGAMYNAPRRFGLSAGFVTGAGGARRGFRDALSAMIMGGGVVSESFAWDALMLNVPERVPVTTHHLQTLGEYGFGETRAQLMGRRGIQGEAGEMQRYMSALSEWAQGRGAAAPAGIAVQQLAESPIGQLHPSVWRAGDRYRGSFLVDLAEANSSISRGAIKKALGGFSQILVPGLATEMWRTPYRLPTGEMVSSESFLGPLQGLLNKVRKAHETGDIKHVREARVLFGDYLNSITQMSGNIMLGRAGTVYDVGASIAGRATFRPYTRMFQADPRLARASRFIVGINPEDYRRLTGLDPTKFDPRRPAMGVTSRFPITTVDPAIIMPDAEVARGAMAVDESLRMMKELDFDGDTLYANIIKGKGAAELREATIGRFDPRTGAFLGLSAAGERYATALETRLAIGGVLEDIERVGGAGESVFAKVHKRLGAFKYFDPSDIDAPQILAKSFTAHIGRYSNFSKQLMFASAAMGGDMIQRSLRVHLSNRIQQVAIDFARQRTIDDPGALAKKMNDAVKLAKTGDIAGANSQFASAMESLGLVQRTGAGTYSLAEDTDILQAYKVLKGQYAAAHQASKLEGHNRIRTETEGMLTHWFAPLEGGDYREFARRFETYQAIMQRELYASRARTAGERLSEQIGQLANLMRARDEAPGLGIPYISQGSAAASSERLSLWNRIKAGAAGSTHILGDAWAMLRGSRYFAPVAGGIALTGGAMAAAGLLTSPAPMRPPEYEGRQRAIQRSPDVAMAGAGGRAPVPGSAYGHVAGGGMQRPRRSQRVDPAVTQTNRRYYVQQTNRTPRMRVAGRGDPYDANAYAQEAAAEMQRLAGGNANVNIIHDATSRRASELELADQLRNDMTGGR